MKRFRDFMKKAFFFTLFIFMTGVTYCQTVTFMGIDIDQSYASFTKALSTKLPGGRVSPDETEYSHITFAGISNCYIAVQKAPNNQVKYILIISDHGISKDEETRLIASYNSKYGQPYLVETHIDSKTQEKCYTYKYKIGDHLINVTPASTMVHIVYFPRWFILQTDDI